MKNKIQVLRLLLMIMTLAIGGFLGYKLLVDFEPVKITMFVVSVMVLSPIIYQIDKRISDE